MSGKVGFGAFYLMWAQRMNWTVPGIHWIVINWLESRGDLAVLRCFRGFGKSTIIDVYFAWRIYKKSNWRLLLQSEADSTALKNSRDTQNILRNHPLTRGLLEDTGTVESWWTHEGKDSDPRNPQFLAKGVLSNVTGSRADEIVNDDVEVPRNITTPELREKLRYRLEEQTHIAVPGAKKLFIGTPHAFDSLYDDEESKGADCLTIPLFNKDFRIDEPKGRNAFGVRLSQFMFLAALEKAHRCCDRTSIIATATALSLLSQRQNQLSTVTGNQRGRSVSTMPNCLSAASRRERLTAGILSICCVPALYITCVWILTEYGNTTARLFSGAPIM